MYNVYNYICRSYSELRMICVNYAVFHQTSLLFDIKVTGKLDQGLTYHYPVISPLSIKPFTYNLPGI